MTGSPTAKHLWYGPIKVGAVLDSFCSDGTWFGTFVLELRPGEGHQQDAVIKFIEFCRAWNRMAADQGADAAEFDGQGEFTSSSLWHLTNADGVVTRIDVAPNFYGADEVSWVEVVV
jgi:hypothetical protein